MNMRWRTHNFVPSVTGRRMLPHVLLKALDIETITLRAVIEARHETFIHARIVGRRPAYRFGRGTYPGGVLLDLPDDVMQGVNHVRKCAKRHTGTQGPIDVPTDTLKPVPIGSLSAGMASDFRQALIWHMDHHETKIVDLVRATGVSRDVINKLISRERSSTTAENALLISAYYGKSLERFIRCEEDGLESALPGLTELLTPDEEAMLEAQVRGILARRGSR